MTQLNLDDFDVINICKRGAAEMQLNKRYITFTRALLEKMGCPAYVRLLLNPATRVFALQECKQTDRDAFRFSCPKEELTDPRYTNSQMLRRALVAAMGENYQENCYYGFPGTYHPEMKAMVFELEQAYERNVTGFCRVSV
ncbi:MAG: hypothetical protein RR576_04955 [Oscillospiraceae bacterium]